MKKVFFIIALFECISLNSTATIYTVNSLLYNNTGSGNIGTLLYCINQANSSVGPHTINFSVAGTINVTTPSLPVLIQSITIDATTAPGYLSSPVITLDGSGSNYNGIEITAAYCALYGLDINNFPYRGVYVHEETAHHFRLGAIGKGCVIRNNQYDGIEITNADSCKIIDNKIGTDYLGTSCSANLYEGIYISTNSNYDSILNNIISCNNYAGIELDSSNNCVIQGNKIGVLQASCVGNEYSGIEIIHGSHDNTIGGSTFSSFNKIVGNYYYGVEIDGNGTIGNLLLGNSYMCNQYDAIGITNGGNNNILPPLITGSSGTTITGTSLPFATIQIFKAQETDSSLCPTTPSNQGVDYLGSITSNASGTWIYNGVLNGYITAIQSDSSNNSSSFSPNFYVGKVGTLLNNCGNVINHLQEIAYQNFKIYPNPISNVLNIDLKEEPINSSLIITTISGQQVYNSSLSKQHNEINLKLKNGVYFIKISQRCEIYQTKLVKQ